MIISVVAPNSDIARAALKLIEEVAQLSFVILFGGDRWQYVEAVAVAQGGDSGEDIIGLASLAPTDEMGEGGPQIIGIWVAIAYRRQGAAMALIDALAVESQARYQQKATIVPATLAGYKLALAALARNLPLFVPKVTGFGSLP